jgi:Family of unknown function (DUF5989)
MFVDIFVSFNCGITTGQLAEEENLSNRPNNEFERIAATDSGGGIFREFWLFLRYNKKWWLTPILLVLLLFGLLIMASGTAVAPFIYTLF